MSSAETVTPAAPPASAARLVHLPLALFAAPMGIGGIGLAWREAARHLGAPAFIGEVLIALACALWVLLVALHVTRALRHPGALAADLSHPVRSAFAGAGSIGLMIVAGGLTPYAFEVAGWIWLVAVALHVGIGAWMVRGLLISPRESTALSPPLLIPLVGNVLAPAFGAGLGYETLGWVLFGLGALLWVLVQPLILSRIILGPKLPIRLQPTLVILLAPPAAAALALARLTHGFGPGPLILLGLGAFFALVFATLVPVFARMPFALSWWAWTFPTAAFALSVLAFANDHPHGAWRVAAWGLLLASSCIVALVSGMTLREAVAGRLLQPEP